MYCNNTTSYTLPDKITNQVILPIALAVGWSLQMVHLMVLHQPTLAKLQYNVYLRLQSILYIINGIAIITAILRKNDLVPAQHVYSLAFYHAHVEKAIINFLIYYGNLITIILGIQPLYALTFPFRSMKQFGGNQRRNRILLFGGFGCLICGVVFPVCFMKVVVSSQINEQIENTTFIRYEYCISFVDKPWFRHLRYVKAVLFELIAVAVILVTYCWLLAKYRGIQRTRETTLGGRCHISSNNLTKSQSCNLNIIASSTSNKRGQSSSGSVSQASQLKTAKQRTQPNDDHIFGRHRNLKKNKSDAGRIATPRPLSPRFNLIVNPAVRKSSEHSSGINNPTVAGGYNVFKLSTLSTADQTFPRNTLRCGSDICLDRLDAHLTQDFGSQGTSNNSSDIISNDTTLLSIPLQLGTPDIRLVETSNNVADVEDKMCNTQEIKHNNIWDSEHKISTVSFKLPCSASFCSIRALRSRLNNNTTSEKILGSQSDSMNSSSSSSLRRHQKAIALCLGSITAYLLCNLPSGLLELAYLVSSLSGWGPVFMNSPASKIWKNIANVMLVFNFTVTFITQLLACKLYRQGLIGLIAKFRIKGYG